MSKYSYNYIQSLNDDEKLFVRRYFNLFSSKKTLVFNEIFDNYSTSASYEEAKKNDSASNSATLSTIQESIGKGLAYFYLDSDYNKHFAVLRRAIVLFEKGFEEAALQKIDEGITECEKSGKYLTILCFLYLKNKISGGLNHELSVEIKRSRIKLSIIFLQKELDNLNESSAKMVLKKLSEIDETFIKQDPIFQIDAVNLKACCFEYLGEPKNALALLDSIITESLLNKGGATDRLLSYFVNCFRISTQHKNEEFFLRKLVEYENYCTNLPQHSFANSKFHRVQIEAKYEFFIKYLLAQNEEAKAYQEVLNVLSNKSDMKLIQSNSALFKIILVASYCAFRAKEFKMSLKLINEYKQYLNSKSMEADLLEIFIHNALGNFDFSDRLTASYFYANKTLKKSSIRLLLNQLKKLKGKKEIHPDAVRKEANLNHIDATELIKIVNQYG